MLPRRRVAGSADTPPAVISVPCSRDTVTPGEDGETMKAAVELLGTVRSWVTVQGPRWAAIILAALIVADATKLGIRATRRSRDLAMERSQREMLASANKSALRGIDLSAIEEAHLFGRNAHGDGRGHRAPMPPIGSFKLTGTIVIEPAPDGYAIIAGADGVPHLYRMSSAIADDVTLAAVSRDHVVLDRAGRQEILRMPRERTGGLELMPSQAPAQEELADADEHYALPPLDRPPPLPTSGAVLRSLNLRPAFEHGERVGMQVGQTVAGRKPLTALGLNAGDVIVSVNGRPEGSSSLGGALMTSINSGQPATLAVERDGRLYEITIDPARAEEAAQLYRSASQP